MIHNKYTSTLLRDDDALLEGSDVRMLKVCFSADWMVVGDEEGRQEWGVLITWRRLNQGKRLDAVLPPTLGDGK